MTPRPISPHPTALPQKGAAGEQNISALSIKNYQLPIMPPIPQPILLK